MCIFNIKVIFGLIILWFAFTTGWQAAEGFVEILNKNTASQTSFELNIVHAAGFAAILYAFSFSFNNIVFMSFFWGVYPLIRVLQVYYESRDTSKSDFNLKALVPLLIFLFYQLFHIVKTLTQFKGFGKQKWIYTYQEKKSGNRLFYWISAFLFFHALPVTLYLYTHQPLMQFLKTNFVVDHTFGYENIMGTIIMFSGLAILTSSHSLLIQYYQDESNKGKNINLGLFKWCRYPHYMGEIMFWWGLYVFTSLENQYPYPIGAFLISLIYIWFIVGYNDEKLMETQENFRSYKNSVISSIVPFIRIGGYKLGKEVQQDK